MVDLAVVGYESFDSLRDRPRTRRTDALIANTCRPTLFIELPKQRGEASIRELATCGS
jgi:hypothetical protein